MDSVISLPPLLSMIIDGLPPQQQSEYVYEAEERLNQFVDRYHHINSLDSYCRVGLSYASYMYPKAISVDRVVAISVNYAIGFLLDDLFIDSPNPFLLDQYGIDRSACETPEAMLLYFDHLDAVFSQQHAPRNLIETMMWESGRDILSLSNQDWFDCFVQAVMEHRHVSVASHADLVSGRTGCFGDLASYTKMRAGNMGGEFIQLMIEFANNSYIPTEMRSIEFLQKVTSTTSVHLGYTNDVYSYHKESSLEANPRNLITVLMECEGKPVAESVHRAVELVKEYGRMILEMKAEAAKWGLEKHMVDIKALIAGNVYYGCMDPRYRQSDSVYLEHRDMTVDWKIAPPFKVSTRRMATVKELQVTSFCAEVQLKARSCGVKRLQIKCSRVKQPLVGCTQVKRFPIGKLLGI
ncbi:hypothetical protein M758_1G114300 [Ceratodon purpureus]|nr:hypothetical protein M758_1G114300 [Ceratodon purpureus]